MKRPLLALTLCTALSAVVAQAQPADPASAAPLRPVTFTTDTPFVHDPVLAFEDGRCYLFCTGTNIGAMTSADRRTWHVQRDGVLRDIPQWTRDSVPGFDRHVWAPDVIRWHGRWWMAYSCSTFGRNTSAIGLLSATSLAAADWHDGGCLVASREGRDNWNAIDPNFIVDDDDRLWMAWGSFWDGIQLAPLAAVTAPDGRLTLRLAAPPQTIARRYAPGAPYQQENPTSRHAGTNAIEAPFIFRHGGYYYLFVSWDYCCRGSQSTYRVAVGRSRHVAGPYVDRQGRPMTEGGGTEVFGGDGHTFEAAGHCAAYALPAAGGVKGADLFVCHGYSIPLQGQSVLVQRAIKWKKGWPVLSAEPASPRAR